MSQSEAPLSLSLSEPFLSSPPTVMAAVIGPNGREELVDPAWLEEKTLVMDREELQRLIEAEQLTHRLTRELHTRPTVRSMEAVMPPSRPVPPVEVVDSQGRRVE